MAQIQSNGEQSVLKIKDFLGLNENPDGDTNIKNGELAKMRNFRITADKHLQIRPGQKTIIDLKAIWSALPDKPDIPEPKGTGVWEGLVAGKQHVLAAYGGVLWDISTKEGVPPKDIGRATQDTTSWFGFSNKVYMLNGHEYMSWDGGADSKFVKVEGYIPTIQTATTPAGAGTKLENVNRLTGKKRVKFSPDGKTATFKLPEDQIDEIVEVTGTEIKFTTDLGAGSVKFNSAPPAGTNTVAIVYRKGNGERAQVEKMHYAELFNGATDSRVFLYGDGTSKTIYSGNDLDKSAPTAEYFPDLFEARVGAENSPVTALIRHYGKLLCFKEDSTWAMDSSIVPVPGGGVITAFNVTPVNKALGNVAVGQVKLLENNPLAFTENGVYQWKSTANFADEHRDTTRVSDRVTNTLSGYDLRKIITFNRHREREFWILEKDEALILNYQTNTWYRYTNMPYGGMAEVDGEIYGFCKDGRIVHISRRYRNDDTVDIDAYAETGSMDFDRDWQTKYSPCIYVAIKPEGGARVNVTAESNRRSGTISYEVAQADDGRYPYKIVAAGLATFANADFSHWSFGTNRKPQVRRVRLKVKKAVFYKLIFWSKSASATATILETDIRMRYAGNVK